MNRYAFSIVVPTYNRAYVLGETLASIGASRFRDLEVVVVDDGSSDDTAGVVDAFARESDLPVRYERQPNQGKHVALNRAAEIAEGCLFLNVDSDDLLLPDSLGQLWDVWQAVPEGTREGWAGVVGNCLREDGALSGTPFPEDVLDSDFLSLRAFHEIRGEKRWAVRSEVMRAFPYPVFPGERHSRPGIVVNRMSHHYRFRFCNRAILTVRHMADGITSNRRRVQVNNPLGYRQYFLEEIRDHAAFSGRAQLRSYYARFVRMSLLGGVGLRRQYREAPNRLMWLSTLPKGVWGYLRDRRRAGGKRSA